MGKARTIALGFILGAIIVYLAVHAVTGRHGLVAFVELQRQERALIAERDALTAERAQLSLRTARLKPESLDIDYLDEKARALLARGAPGELVFAVEPRG
ncbi:MAG: septum formation initiator family protein [Hyphomonadaceae bacterium]|nr:septum formation initiator family protein [Hyphomonadaceae bacterium]